ncbi:peptidylprolyl isomerase [Sphingomonas hankookensis]|uniref:peptidylprolyl isomerase n=1 Tax=Sphingomonas hankookensis TaxID=563996 RepID=UPI001F569BCD|nr:peptidylprolyl isomerase [Sphingomonas hankookensis]
MDDGTDLPVLRLDTSLGPIDVALALHRAPRTARHVMELVQRDLLSPATFYRAVRPTDATDPPTRISVLQGGVGWQRCEDLPGVVHEPTSVTGLRHVDGAVSIGRWADRPATSELFICLGDQPSLDARPGEGPFDAGFAVFGQVVGGMDVVRQVHRLACDGPPPPGHGRFDGQFLTDAVPFSTQLIPSSTGHLTGHIA